MKINIYIKLVVFFSILFFLILFFGKNPVVTNLKESFILKKDTRTKEILELSAKITSINNIESFIKILKLSEVFDATFFKTTFNFVKSQNKKFNEFITNDITVNEYNFIDYFSNKKEFFEWLVVATQTKFNNNLLTESNLNSFLKKNLNELFSELKKTKNRKNTEFTKDEYEYVVIFGSHYTNIKTRLDFALKAKHTNKNFIILTNSRIININNIDKNINGKQLTTYNELQQEHNNKSSDVNIAYFIIKDNFVKKYKKDNFSDPETEKLFIKYLQKQKSINKEEINKRIQITDKIKNKIKISTNENAINEKTIANYVLSDSFYKKLNITILDTNVLNSKEISANTDEMLLNFLNSIQKGNKKEFFKNLKKINIAFVSSNPYFFLKKEQVARAFEIFFENEVKENKIKQLLKNNVEIVVCSNILKNNTTILREYLKMFADIIYIQYNQHTQNNGYCLKYECLLRDNNIKNIIN